MKVRANDLTIWWGGCPVAYATTAELDVQRETYEVGSATSGMWRTYKAGRMSWSLSAGHLIDTRSALEHDDITGDPFVNPFYMLKNGQKVTVVFGTMDRANGEPIEAGDQSSDKRLQYTGEVIVRRYTVSAVKGQVVTCQFEAVGCGELKEMRKVSKAVIMEQIKEEYTAEVPKGKLLMDLTINANFMFAQAGKEDAFFENLSGLFGLSMTVSGQGGKKPEELATYIWQNTAVEVI